MKNKGCGTCRGQSINFLYLIFLLTAFPDRRILCDRGLPACAQCTRSNRICQGYGLRLSWPKANDQKRFLTGKTSSDMKNTSSSSKSLLVNVSAWDLKMHYYLATSARKGYPPVLNITAFTPLKLKPGQGYLLQYCECIQCNSAMLEN